MGTIIIYTHHTKYGGDGPSVTGGRDAYIYGYARLYQNSHPDNRTRGRVRNNMNMNKMLE